MNTRLGGRSTRARSVRLIGALALGAAALALAAPANTAGAVTLQTVVFANIGDVPYTSAQTPLLSALTAHVNADPDVEFVAHTGDFKGGSDSCSDTAFQNTFNGFQRVVIDHGDQHNNRYDPVYDVAHPNISRLENWGSNTGGMARSSGGCNGVSVDLGGCSPVEDFAGSAVHLGGDELDLVEGDPVEVGALREVLA